MSTFNPAEYGLTPVPSTANLLNAISAYRQAVEKLAGTATPLQQVESTVREKISADAEISSKVADLVSSLRSDLFSAIYADPALSVGIYDALGTITKDVKEVRDWYVNKCAKNVRVDIPVSATNSDLVTAAEELRKFICNLFSFFDSDSGKGFAMPGPDGSMVKLFSAEDWAKVPTKKNKAGEHVLALPNVPGSRKSSGNAGRGVAYRITNFTVSTGDSNAEIPAGTHLRDVLISHCSDSQNVFTVSWILAELKRTGQEMGSAPGSSWKVTLPNGKVLSGWVPADAVVEDESDEDESEDEDNS